VIPSNVSLFTFPGYGPELSRGLAVLTQDGRLVLAEAPGNPGTSLTNAIEAAVPTARRNLNLDEETEVFQWIPNDRAKPNAVWQIEFDEGEPTWMAVEWEKDKSLTAAVEALRRAGADGEPWELPML
jgi:hypothetical protein